MAEILDTFRTIFSKRNARGQRALDAGNDLGSECATEQGARISDLEARLRHVRSPVLATGEEGDQTDRLLNHPVRNAFPKVQLGSWGAIPQPNRLEIATRLIKAYRLAMDDPDRSKFLAVDAKRDMWSRISQNVLSDVVRAAESGDPRELANALEKFGSSFIPYGGISTCIDGYNRNRSPDHIALTYWDALARIGEYLGITRVENPESGPWGDALHQSPAELVGQIEDKLGISISPPLGIIHTDGLKVGDTLFHYRHANSLYAAIRLRELDTHFKRRPKILEIGGGIGITAVYANRLGIEHYTMLDIPITCLLCGNYLLNSLGLNFVTLFGEPHREGTVRVLPFWKCTEFPDVEFDICINQDSLNEMSEDTRKFYGREIARLTEGFFLSINHEYFFPKTVGSLLAQDRNYLKLSRSPYWARAGYVEELYKVERL